ncbi:hypothetical protein GOP47_0031147 [Adiantum capillus-veneris]|nr:hypothetical protein GOP47_0031146 [Adiantum capillus-veneris]KAI5053962.1 hypothetical protein GOP47_0031147 [Adiantum capillus-veneris]
MTTANNSLLSSSNTVANQKQQLAVVVHGSQQPVIVLKRCSKSESAACCRHPRLPQTRDGYSTRLTFFSAAASNSNLYLQVRWQLPHSGALSLIKPRNGP